LGFLTGHQQSDKFKKMVVIFNTKIEESRDHHISIVGFSCLLITSIVNMILLISRSRVEKLVKQATHTFFPQNLQQLHIAENH
jgi:hypothetical protein